MKTLRETPGFIATQSARGTRITAKEKGVEPRSRVVRQSTWEQLARMSDNEFDGSCIIDLNIGVHKRD